MKLIDKDQPDGEAVHMPWDAGMAALASGAFDPHKIEGERGPDQPAAQMPKPGTDPVGGKETVEEGEVLTNLAPSGLPGAPPPGLPREPAPQPTNVVKPAVVQQPSTQAAEAAKAETAKAGTK